MNKLKTILFTLLALMTTMVMAQQARTLTGVVVDDFNEPIPGANIVVSNQQNRALKGTVTDIDGNFVLTMPPGEKFNIQISYIGMKTQRIEYKGQTTLKVKMSEDSRMLAGAEVTAQRVERSELGVSFREQTSATQKISMVEITEVAPVASIEEALQGQAAGLDIVLGGDPGAKSSIRIRGTSTLSSNAAPLVLPRPALAMTSTSRTPTKMTSVHSSTSLLPTSKASRCSKMPPRQLSTVLRAPMVYSLSLPSKARRVRPISASLQSSPLRRSLIPSRCLTLRSISQ